MRKELRKKAEGGAWQGMWTIHQQLNKDGGNNKFPLKKKGKVFFLKEIVSPGGVGGEGKKNTFNPNFVLLLHELILNFLKSASASLWNG